MEKKENKIIIITGGAGFIGSHVVRLFVNKYPNYKIINLDALTYAGNLENLKDIEDAPNYVFERVNLLDVAELERLLEPYKRNTSDFSGRNRSSSVTIFAGGFI